MPNLAARCPACSTVFRVVPDQLRVSEGWVRCGRCSEVFNAAESLIDLDTGVPMHPAEVTPAAPVAPPERVAEAPRPAPEPAPLPEAESTAGIAFDLHIAPPPATAVADFGALDVDPQRPLGRAALERAADDGDAPAPPELDLRPAPEDQPSFVRRADRAERWRQPRVRLALAAGVLLATLALAGQIAHVYSDLIAARFPATRSALGSACALLGCRVQAVHAIDSLAVESSGLVRVEKSNIYKLQLALRNRAAIEVAVPALDLTLSDSQGKLLARRVLRATELGVNQGTLAAGRELALQATLQAATEPVAGYTLELFYP